MARRAKRAEDRDPLEADLEDLPPELRWRDWMGRVEAVIFASPHPVPRERLAALVGPDCNLELLIEDIGAEVAARPDGMGPLRSRRWGLAKKVFDGGPGADPARVPDDGRFGFSETGR